MIAQASDITCLKRAVTVMIKISVLFYESHCKKISARCRAGKHFNLYSKCFVDQENICFFAFRYGTFHICTFNTSINQKLQRNTHMHRSLY